MKMKKDATPSKASACQKSTKPNERSSELTAQMSVLLPEKTTYKLSRPESPPVGLAAKSEACPSDLVNSWGSKKLTLRGVDSCCPLVARA